MTVLECSGSGRGDMWVVLLCAEKLVVPYTAPIARWIGWEGSGKDLGLLGHGARVWKVHRAATVRMDTHRIGHGTGWKPLPKAWLWVVKEHSKGRLHRATTARNARTDGVAEMWQGGANTTDGLPLALPPRTIPVAQA